MDCVSAIWKHTVNRESVQIEAFLFLLDSEKMQCFIVESALSTRSADVVAVVDRARDAFSGTNLVRLILRNGLTKFSLSYLL